MSNVKFSIKFSLGGLALLLGVYMIGYNMFFKDDSTGKKDPVVQLEDHDYTISNDGIFGYQALDFKEAIEGACSQEQMLLVYTQDIVYTDTFTDTGLFNWEIFDRTQSFTLPGTGNYYVDLDSVSDTIEVDNMTGTVTVYIPHVTEQTVADMNQMTVVDAERGLLGWGDVKTKTEDIPSINSAMFTGIDAMLNDEVYMNAADTAAITQVQEFLEPFVQSTAPAYRLEVMFQEA